MTIRQKSGWRRLTAAGALALLAAGVVTSSSPGAAALPAPRPLPVASVSLLAASGYEVTRSYTGRLEARRATDLGFDRAGRLAAVLAVEGATVEAGAALARLDIRRLEARRAEMDAQLARAGAVLAELRAGERSETLAAAEAEVGALRASLELTRLKRDRRIKLAAERVISAEALEEANFGLRAAEARLEAAERRLDELLAGTRDERLRAQEALIAELEAARAGLLVDLEESVLRAPFAGVVGRIRADEGSMVDPGRPLLRLVEAGALEAWVGVPAGPCAPLRLGAELAIEVGGQRLPARLTGILPELDPVTRTRTLVLRVDGAPPGVAPGQVVRLLLTDRVESPGFWLPLAALAKGERGLWSVLVLTRAGSVGPHGRPSGAALASGALVSERRHVDVLHVDTDRAYVRGDLAADDRVVAAGVQRIVPGQVVSETQP